MIMDMIYENDSETMAESVFEELRSFDGNRNDSLGQLLPMAMNLNAIEPDSIPADIELCEATSKPSNANQMLTNQNNDGPNFFSCSSLYPNNLNYNENSLGYLFESQPVSPSTSAFEHYTYENQGTDQGQQRIDNIYGNNDVGNDFTVSDGQTYQNLTITAKTVNEAQQFNEKSENMDISGLAQFQQVDLNDANTVNMKAYNDISMYSVHESKEINSNPKSRHVVPTKDKSNTSNNQQLNIPASGYVEHGFQNFENKNQLFLENNPDNPLVLVPLSMLGLKSSAKSLIPSDAYSNRNMDAQKAVISFNDSNQTLRKHQLNVFDSKESSEKYNFNVSTKAKQKVQHLTPTNFQRKKPSKDDAILTNQIAEVRNNKLTHSKDFKKLRRKCKSEPDINGSSNLCQICGELAGKHSYYGGRSCQSCRAFFRRSAETLARTPDYEHPCSCIEGCRQKDKAVCTMNRDTRNSCRFCRYMKCRNAGMVKEWVLSAYLVKSKDAEKTSIRPKVDSKKKAVSKDDNNSNSQKENKSLGSNCNSTSMSDDIRTLIKKDTLCDSVDKQLIDQLGSSLYSKNEDNIINLNKLLEMKLTHHISLIAMSLDEFICLDSITRVHLLKRKSRQLVKLCLMKLVHDHILLQSDMKSFNASILMSLFFPSKSPSTSQINFDPTSSDQSSTRMFGKINELFSNDGEIFMFIFALLLFNSNGEEDSIITKTSPNELIFMQYLQEYLLFQSKGNQSKAAIRLGNMTDVIHFIQTL